MAPVEIQHLSLNGHSPFQQKLDPREEFLYAVAVNLSDPDPTSNALYELAVMPDGTLKLAAPPTILPVPVDTHAAGAAVQ